MKYAGLIAASIFSSFSFASFETLHKEFINNNNTLKELSAQKNIAALENDLTQNNNPWTLFYNYADIDSSLASMPGATALPPSVTKTHSFGISKDFDWGGNLTLSNNFLNYDGIIETNSVGQTISYKQQIGDNFLGRVDRASKRAALLKKTGAEKNVEVGVLQNEMLFYNSYLGCSASKLALKLQEENLNRALTRTSTVAKRVRDGLSLKVELIQTQMAENGAKEAVLSAQNKFSECRKDLEKMIHRSVLETEIESLKLEYVQVENVKKDSSENPDIVTIRKNQIELAQQNYEMNRYSIMPKVELSLNYKTNSYQDTMSEAFSEGNLSSDNNERTVALNMVWPIFSKPQKIASEMAHVNLMLATKRDEIAQKDFDQEIETLNSSLVNVELILQSVDKRLEMASLALKEYNNLYTLGKADLDLVLRAEETFIMTQLNFAQSLLERNAIQTAIAFKTGSLNQLIANFKE